MKIAFTGHRPNKLGGYNNNTNQCVHVLKGIQREIPKLQKIEPVTIISGMALGVDTWAAEYAIFNNIPFLAYVPFVGQELAWPIASQKAYRRILSKADTIKIVCSGSYAPWKMQERNKAMVNDCDVLIAVWDGTTGGTGNCVQYALSIKKRIIRIHPFDQN